MTFNSKKSPRVKHLLGVWTVLWVIVSMALSFSLFSLQLNQSNVLVDGMKEQTSLLTGGNNEVTR